MTVQPSINIDLSSQRIERNASSIIIRTLELQGLELTCYQRSC